MDTIYTIPAYNLDRLTHRLDTLIRKVGRMNTGSVSYSIGETGYQDYLLDGKKTQVLVVNVTVSGDSPVYNGWEFVAVLEPTENGNMIRGGDVPEVYRTSSMFCDHCKSDRNRSQVYVLRHESGAWAQVGSSCIKDFLGHPSPQALAAYAEILFDLETGEGIDEYWEVGGRKFREFELDLFLATAIDHVSRFGFISKSKAYDMLKIPTSDMVWDTLIDGKESVSPELLAQARDMISFCNEHLSSTSDYEWNLSLILAGEFVSYRTAGYATSLVTWYSRKRAELLSAESSRSAWVGKVGDKVDVDVTITKILPTMGQYGVVTLISMVDGDGNIYTWWKSGHEETQAVGDCIRVSGKVKSHTEFQSIKQTTLTRCKFTRVN